MRKLGTGGSAHLARSALEIAPTLTSITVVARPAMITATGVIGFAFYAAAGSAGGGGGVGGCSMTGRSPEGFGGACATSRMDPESRAEYRFEYWAPISRPSMTGLPETPRTARKSVSTRTRQA